MKSAEEAQAAMRRIGLKLIEERKTEILAEMGKSGIQDDSIKTGVRGRDLLTLLIKANMTVDNTNGQRLSDEEVLGRECSELSLPLSSPTKYLQRFQRTSWVKYRGT